MVTEGRPQGWDAKVSDLNLLAVPLRAQRVDGDDVRVPAITPASKVVIGHDPYSTVTATPGTAPVAR